MWWCLLAAFARPLSFDEALDEALDSNLELASQRLDNERVHVQLVRARGGFDPRLTAGVSVDQSRTPSNQATDVGGAAAVVTSSSRSTSLGLTQALPTGGALSASASESQTVTDSTNALSARFVSNRVGVNLSQPLLRGAFLGELATLRDAQLAVAVQELAWRQQLEQLVLSVADAYWGLVSARERLVLAERGVQLAAEQLDDTKERLREGFAGTGDVLQVEVALGQASAARVDAEAGVGSASDRLARLLGLPLAEGARLELTDLPELPDRLPSAEELAATAEERNAALGIARLQLLAAERDARRGRNAALPDLSLDAGASLSAGGVEPAAVRADLFGNPAPSYGAGLTLGLPVVPRQALADLATARIGLQQAQLAWEAAQQDLQLSVADAARDLQRQQASLANAQATRQVAAQSLAAQQELLDEGRGSTRDVVDALEALRSAEASELDARIQLQLALLRAEQVAGLLVTEEQAP
jgi:outer membrane protein